MDAGQFFESVSASALLDKLRAILERAKQLGHPGTVTVMRKAGRRHTWSGGSAGNPRQDAMVVSFDELLATTRALTSVPLARVGRGAAQFQGFAIGSPLSK
eukprot:1981092-Alexandrium_andersonii.AAC.1